MVVKMTSAELLTLNMNVTEIDEEMYGSCNRIPITMLTYIGTGASARRTLLVLST